MIQNQIENNQISLIGEVVTELRYSHYLNGEHFYEMELLVERLSENVDVLPVMISERLINIQEDYRCDCISITGQLHSFYYHEAEKTHLKLYVFADSILFLERRRTEITRNEVYLEGYLYKPPLYRKTPKGREITELILAVPRVNGKEDCIPCISWGRNARFVKMAQQEEPIRVWGRFQSREYQKKEKNRETVTNITYEVSVNRLG